MRDGSLYVVDDTCYLKYYIIEGEKRVHKTLLLCKRSDAHDWWKKRGKWGYSSAVRQLQRETMDKIRADAKAAEIAALALTKAATPGEMRVVDFWEKHYLPYIEKVLPLTGLPRRKPSTIRGYKQIWKQHLKEHFGTTTLMEYEPAMGKRFLRSLTGTQGKATLKHIKALAGSLFGYAVEEEFIKVNPWHDVKIPDDAIESKATAHYTLPEVETIVSSLVEHVDAQLVVTLACFLGLRPGEIAALKWEDFDAHWGDLKADWYVHIRRSVVRGIVGTPKTAESIASLPLAEQVKVPLRLWWEKSDKPTEGWVFPSESDTPVDLHNLVARVIRPHVEGSAYQIKGTVMKCIRCNKVPNASGAHWKTVYAGRRGAITAIVEKNNGNLAIGQALARHKSYITTATFYKKAVTPETLRNGMKNLELAAGTEGK